MIGKKRGVNSKIIQLIKDIGAEKVPGAPVRRGKLSLTRGNFVIPDKGSGIFPENLVFLRSILLP